MTNATTSPPTAAHGRRHPWFSYLLIASLISGFAFVQSQGSVARGGTAREEAQGFFEEQPLVGISPRFESWLGMSRVTSLREAFLADREAQGRGAPSERYMERYERAFAPLHEAAVAELDAIPELAHRLEGRRSPGVNHFVHPFVDPDWKALAVAIAFLVVAGFALESAWGSLTFGALCCVAGLGGGAVFLARHGDTGQGWLGASAIVAAVLGAYLVRAFAGFRIPGWLLLPAWFGLEYFVVRGATWQTLGDEPFEVHAAAVGLGFALAAGVALLRVEASRHAKQVAGRELVSKSALDRALEARENDRPGDAFEILADEFEQSPRDLDVAIALWDSAVEIGQPQLGQNALLAVLRDAVRRRNTEATARHFLDLESKLETFEAEPPLLVYVAEALHEDGRPTEAARAVARALDAEGGLPGAMARRAAIVAQRGDPALAARAAERALADPQIPAEHRSALQSLVHAHPTPTPTPTPAPAPTAPVPASSLPRNPSAPHPQTPGPGADAAQDPLAFGSVALDALTPGASSTALDVDAQTDAEGWRVDHENEGIPIDALAEVSVDSDANAGGWTFDRETSGISPLALESVSVGAGDAPVWSPLDDGLPLESLQAVDVGVGAAGEGVDPATVEGWNDPHRLDAVSGDSEPAPQPAGSAATPGPASEAPVSSAGEAPAPVVAGEAIGSSPDSDVPISDDDLASLLEDEAGPDVAAIASEALGSLLDEPDSPPTTAAEASVALPTGRGAANEAPSRPASPVSRPEPAALDESPSAPIPSAPRLAAAVDRAVARPLHRIEGRTVELRSDGLVFHVEGKGRNRLAWDRIEAIAVGAVPGDAGRTALVVDLLLDWSEVGDAPLRLVRLGSRGFDPALVPDAANPMDAMQRFVASLLQHSGAEALPGRDACLGRPFARFASLADYEREVLGGA